MPGCSSLIPNPRGWPRSSESAEPAEGREPDGDFSFWIRTHQPDPLYFGFSHPDSPSLVKSTRHLPALPGTSVLPEPATLAHLAATDAAGCSAGSSNLTPVTVHAGGGERQPGSSTSLVPGPGSLQSHTALARIQPYPGRLGNGGQFYDRRTFELKSGVPGLVTFEAPRFDPDAWKGTRSVIV